MGYSSYLRSVGAKKGEYKAFVMTRQQFLNLKNAEKSVSQQWDVLNQRLSDCQLAWYSSMQNGLVEDANHAKINERNAYKALLEFEKISNL